MIDDKQIEGFFRSMKDIDRDLITIEEFKHRVKMVQNKFEENEKCQPTKPIESSDPHNDLRVVWSADGKRIHSDKRPD